MYTTRANNFLPTVLERDKSVASRRNADPKRARWQRCDGVLLLFDLQQANRALIPSLLPAVEAEAKRSRGFLLKMKSTAHTAGDLAVKQSEAQSVDRGIGVVSLHHVGLLCENLEKSLRFYQDLLGLEINEDRPHDKLPYRGAWLWVGSEMIHLMELPNPDPLTGRPEHGGRDRHACIAIKDVLKLKTILDEAGIQYTLSRSGRPAIFARDPDGNALEFTQVD